MLSSQTLLRHAVFPSPDEERNSSTNNTKKDQLLHQAKPMIFGRWSHLSLRVFWLLESLRQCYVQLVAVDCWERRPDDFFVNGPNHQQFQSIMTDMQEVEKADLEFRVGTFFWYFQLSTLCNLDRLRGLVSCPFGHVLDLLDDVVALQDLSEYDVFAI